MEQRHEHLATKTDLAALQLEVRDQKVELKGEIAALQLEVRDQKVELMGVINGQKADLTKSIYFMGLVQFLAIMGGVLAIVTLMLK